MHIHTPRHTAVLQPHTPVCTHTHATTMPTHIPQTCTHPHTQTHHSHAHTPHNRAHTPRHTPPPSLCRNPAGRKKGGRRAASPTSQPEGTGPTVFSLGGEGGGAFERNCRFSRHPRRLCTCVPKVPGKPLSSTCWPFSGGGVVGSGPSENSDSHPLPPPLSRLRED